MIEYSTGRTREAVAHLRKQVEFIREKLAQAAAENRRHLLLTLTEANLNLFTLAPKGRESKSFTAPFKAFRDELIAANSNGSFMKEYPFALDASIALAEASVEKDDQVKVKLLARALTCFLYIKDEAQIERLRKRVKEPVKIMETEGEVIKYLSAEL